MYFFILLFNSVTSQFSANQDFQFIKEPRDVDATLGKNVIFECEASSEAKIQWRSNERNILHNSSDIILLGNRLQVKSSSETQFITIDCVAESFLGQILLSRKAQIRLYQIRSKPTITNRPLETIVKRGETIVLHCGATGFPHPTYSWFKDGGRLSLFHDRFQVNTKDGSLVITNAQLEDSAHYRCSATNYLGRASSAARVKVNLDIPEALPTFTSKPRHSTVMEGSIVEFTCIASGHPYPDLSWWKNHRLVNSNDRITVSDTGSHLRIQDVKKYDQGDYVCKAENSLGQVEVYTSLNVKSIPSPPKFTKTPHDMTAPRQSSIQLSCSATGSPHPEIRWYKNGNALSENEKIQMSFDGILIIKNFDVEDEGNYDCEAYTENNSINSSATLRLRGGEIKTASISNHHPGDDLILASFESALSSVNEALNSTIKSLFDGKGPVNSSELLTIFRYPGQNDREVARSAEVYERTLELVAEKLRSNSLQLNLSDFAYEELLSADNLYLLANLSGCESHRNSRNIDCSQDMCFHSKYRSIDGVCNNFAHPLYGASLIAFKRNLPAQYENGFNSPIGWNPHKLYNGFKKPSARLVSSNLISASKITPDSELSYMVMQWGQFLDHDMDHSMEAISRVSFEDGLSCSGTCGNRPPCFPIEVPLDDKRISKSPCIEFTRSSSACGSGTTSVFFSKLQPREQLNQLTSFIDGSQVYGSRNDIAISLRNLTNDFGRLKEGPTLNYEKPLLPFNEGNDPVDCRRDPRASNIGCFVAGDVRANEHLGLLAIHTLFLRHHNSLTTKLRHLNSHWTSDQLYHEARKILGAQLQHITYSHWLPLILGSEGIELLGKYEGYNPSVNPSISNVFATSAFRFGHTLINPILRRLNRNFTSIDEGDISLHESFFSPWRLVQEGGIDPILRGLIASKAKKWTPHEVMNSELTEKLFDVAHSVALDLAALNIQRGRDHGLPSYTEWRDWCGLDSSSINSWESLKNAIKNDHLRKKLQKLYGHPRNIDVWVGSLLEESSPGSKIGATIKCLIVDQFKRLRDGDRFWYENPSTFKPEQLAQIKQTTLARIICDNSDDIQRLAPNVFKMKNNENENETYDFVDCDTIPVVNYNSWFECEEEDSDVISFTRSRRHASNVCINYDGGIKSENEEWRHDSKDRCASCICQNQQIRCQEISC